MQNTPKGLRLQIGVYGKRNAGKSSVLNVLARQKVSIVSDTPGTTTDPVEKAMELLPLGPVLFIDTAGLDDIGPLGIMRTERSRKMIERTDLALILSSGSWDALEDELLADFSRRGIPVIVVFGKSDLHTPAPDLVKRLDELHVPHTAVSVPRNEGFSELRQAIIRSVPESFISAQGMLDGLIVPGKACVLVTPIDLEAPKGRLILPQVQAIRDILDHDASCITVKENALSQVLASLKEELQLETRFALNAPEMLFRLR